MPFQTSSGGEGSHAINYLSSASRVEAVMAAIIIKHNA